MTDLDPSEVEPTDNSTGSPVDEARLDKAKRDSAQAAEDALLTTPGPAGGDPAIEGLAGTLDEPDA